MKDRVLFVDDEPEILSSYRRQLRGAYEVETADSGAAGLAVLEKAEPFPVVVSDMRMPAMDGVEFLRRVKQLAPHTVRIMLTGNADTETAIHAVNEGSIFRFLTKPCRPESLTLALSAGVEQYRLLESERELLEKTLRGSVKVLTDTLSLLNPAAFSRGTRIRGFAKQMAIQLELPTPWQYELAAMLSQIGCVTVPPAVLDKALAGRALSPDEAAMYAYHPLAGAELLANIPRLEQVARMIEGQQKPFRNYERGGATPEQRAAVAGAQLLKLCLDFDALVQQGATPPVALELLQRREGEYNPRMVAVLFGIVGNGPDALAIREVRCDEARENMTAAEHIRTKAGALLVPKDQDFTPHVLARLRNFASRVGIEEPFRVYVRASAD